MSKDLLKKLSELEGEVYVLEISEPSTRNLITNQQPLIQVMFYYAPPEDLK